MELAHSLLLNEEALSKIPDNKKPVFVYEWLRFLDKVLVAAQKVMTSWIVNMTYQYICTLLILIYTRRLKNMPRSRLYLKTSNVKW